MRTIDERENYMAVSEEDRKICDGSMGEVMLYYLVNPALFLTHVYETLITFRWKFYF